MCIGCGAAGAAERLRRFTHTWRRRRRRRAQGGWTALISAAVTGYADCARLLLDAGADKNATDQVRARAGRWYGGGNVECCMRAFSCVATVWTGCDLNKFAICLSVFEFCFLTLFRYGFCAFCAPNRVAAPKSS